ncbi:hypothetical protein CPB83DRAFT_864026 [Crepidotus variabilis]|uniref:Uncharacterized protein n=1 Tax=Crepidotus variabilis TaxID=179855 RepID=A0A9P6E5D8_9AGAR|nr:hypothetical protein CPB83DRAFT_864026 [Crepidotus variabilis]
MSSFSVGTYSGGTAFVGFGSFLPTYISPFHIAVGGTTIQQVAIASTAVGAGFGVYATYAGFFDASVHARRRKTVAQAQSYNATAVGVKENVGVHWLDFDVSAGYFPLNLPAHVNDGESSILLSVLDSAYSECAAETVAPSVKWKDYSAGHFTINIPIFNDNGNESVIQSALRPEPTVCAPEEAPVPTKWLEYATEYVPNVIDLFVDDDVPFGYATKLVCPFDSEKVERAFVTLRNPPTHIQINPTRIRPAIDTSASSIQLLLIALFTVICIALGTMHLIVIGHGSKMKTAVSKSRTTPASLVIGGRRRNKKAKKPKKKPTKPKPFTRWLDKFSIVIGPGLEALD